MTDRYGLSRDRSRTRRNEESDEVSYLLRACLAATAQLNIGSRGGRDSPGADGVDRETRSGEAVGEILGGDDQGGVADRAGDIASKKGVLTAHADDPSVPGPGHDRQRRVGQAKERHCLRVDRPQHLIRIGMARCIEGLRARSSRDDQCIKTTVLLDHLLQRRRDRS